MTGVATDGGLDLPAENYWVGPGFGVCWVQGFLYVFFCILAAPETLLGRRCRSACRRREPVHPYLVDGMMKALPPPASCRQACPSGAPRLAHSCAVAFPPFPSSGRQPVLAHLPLHVLQRRTHHQRTHAGGPAGGQAPAPTSASAAEPLTALARAPAHARRPVAWVVRVTSRNTDGATPVPGV